MDTVKMRCINKRSYFQGSLVATEIGLNTQDRENKPLQEEVLSGSVNLVLVSEKENMEFSLGELVTLKIEKAPAVVVQE